MSKWPLAISNFTLWDKLKVSKWLLTQEQWTQGSEVRKYEQTWENYTKCPHVIMVANGSVANELIALRRKWELQQSGEWPKKNKVVFPVVNWISSISPWINLGFEPVFMDVDNNLCSTDKNLLLAIKGYEDNIAAVFYTTLLGYKNSIQQLLDVSNFLKVPLYLDNCESSFSEEIFSDNGLFKVKHISNIVTSSTSLYFSHHTSGNQEGGLIFCQSDEENEWYRMARNHGMTRGMPDKYKNPDVDSAFDFYLMGSNYRSTNLLAYMCSLDFDRALNFSEERKHISNVFSVFLDSFKFETPHHPAIFDCPLSLPIIAKEVGLIDKVKKYLKDNDIEYRPIVSGNLLYQTAFKKYGNPKDFPRADYIHHNGIYIGLHTKVTSDMVIQLAKEISKL